MTDSDEVKLLPCPSFQIEWTATSILKIMAGHRMLLQINADGTVEGEIEDAGEAAKVFVEYLRELTRPPVVADEVVERDVLNDVFRILDDAPELNMSNYDHDQVAELNAAMIEAYLVLQSALASMPAVVSGGQE